MLSPEASLNKRRRTKHYGGMYDDHDAVNLETNNKITRKFSFV